MNIIKNMLDRVTNKEYPTDDPNFIPYEHVGDEVECDGISYCFFIVGKESDLSPRLHICGYSTTTYEDLVNCCIDLFEPIYHKNGIEQDILSGDAKTVVIDYIMNGKWFEDSKETFYEEAVLYWYALNSNRKASNVKKKMKNRKRPDYTLLEG